MNVSRTFRWNRLVIAALLLLSLVLPLGVSATPVPLARASVDPLVLRQTDGAAAANFWVILRAKADLRSASSVKSWAARGSSVVDQLQRVATSSQADLRKLLESRGVRYRPFWIVNALYVTADRATLDALASRPEVAKIVPSRVYQIPTPRDRKRSAGIESVEWNIDSIRAPEVWSTFGDRGDGIVVASIDTGVQFDHPALVAQYRGNQGNGVFDHNYNWYDPLNQCGSPSLAPCDDVFHGTHTMGTMVGDDGDPGANQIGVAPHAKWIAAKGCDPSGCSDVALMGSGQWVLAPTDLNGQNPRPDLRPQIVNNSWGGGPGDEFYAATVDAWVASGIFPVFSAGNSGPGCGTVGSPGDYSNTYAVGAFDGSNTIAFFSSRGPSTIGGQVEVKPNISAPGVDVRSSVPGNDYAFVSGTSMAAPHVAGTVALIWSAAPALIGDIAGTRALLDQTAIDMVDTSCDGGYPPPPGPNVDNNVWGEGRLDAFAAVDRSPRGPTGVISGTVTDAATGSPIPEATVRVTGPFTRTVSTDSAGAYSMRVPVGTYDVTASAFGYLSQTASGVVIAQDSTVLQSFALVAAPTHAVAGHVRDSTGVVIPGATVLVQGTPISPTITDANGFYQFDAVPEGTYVLRADAGGCNDAQAQSLTVAADETLDFALPQRVDGYGYFCRLEAGSYIDATTPFSLTGDENTAQADLPFPFTFYGQTYNSAFVNTNGYLNFLDFNSNLFNTAIPSPFLPNAAVYPFWDDLLLDTSSSMFTDIVGAAPNRGFVIEWRNAAFWSSPSERVSFEAVLYENGEILTQYKDIDDTARDQGGSATLGIENETGTIALQYSSNTPLVHNGLAIRYDLPPSGFVQGIVTEAVSNQPVSGASVRALSNGSVVRETTTDAQGAYRLQLPLGTYTLEATGPNYSVESAEVTLSQEGAIVTQDFALRSARAEVSPSTFTFVVPVGQQKSATLTLSNTGTLDLAWEMREVGGASPAALPAIPKIKRDPTWSAPAQLQRLPLALPKAIVPHALDSIINDPSGDAQGSVDITTVRGGSTDGVSAAIAIDFTDSTPMDQVVGYVFLDTDQNPATGVPPGNFFGLPSQDVGVEYLADLFNIHGSDPVVNIVSAETFQVVASVPAVIEGHTVAFDVPFAAINDDGQVNVAMVLGDFFAPSDWAPDVGHGTIVPFTDVPWLSESPTSGDVAPGASQAIAITVDTAGLEPGVYDAFLVIQSNSASQPSLRVPVHLVVPSYRQAVNNGGAAYTDLAGEVWAADQAYSAGSWGYINQARTASTRRAIAGTDDDLLYQTARRGLVEYRFDGLPTGVYQVELRFAEIQGKQRDKRLFDVIVEGNLVLPAHDIAAEVGAYAADEHSFFVPVTDGQLSVRLVTRQGYSEPLISAIRVTNRPDRSMPSVRLKMRRPAD